MLKIKKLWKIINNREEVRGADLDGTKGII